MNKIKFIVLLFLIVGCGSNNIHQDAVRDIPKKIKVVYLKNLIDSKETAIKLGELIIRDYYSLKEINLKVLSANLVSDEKVWDILFSNAEAGFTHRYIIRLNRNTGEVLNIWRQK
jgi:hypothetical protein